MFTFESRQPLPSLNNTALLFYRRFKYRKLIFLTLYLQISLNRFLILLLKILNLQFRKNECNFYLNINYAKHVSIKSVNSFFGYFYLIIFR